MWWIQIFWQKFRKAIVATSSDAAHWAQIDDPGEVGYQISANVVLTKVTYNQQSYATWPSLMSYQYSWSFEIGFWREIQISVSSITTPCFHYSIVLKNQKRLLPSPATICDKSVYTIKVTFNHNLSNGICLNSLYWPIHILLELG